MKKLIYIAMLILLSSFVLADQQILSAWVTVATGNGVFDMNIEGGTAYRNISCLAPQNISYTLVTARNVDCTSSGSTENGSCDLYFRNFTRAFGIFTEAYNHTNTDFWDSCIDTKQTNTMLAKEKIKLEEDLKACQSGQNTSDTYWYDLYVKEDDELKECLKRPDMSAQYTVCSQDLKESKQSEKDNTWKVALISCIATGAGAYIFFIRKEKAKQPIHRLPPG